MSRRAKQAKEAAADRRAVGYVRVSSQEQALGGLSLDAQEERVRAYCALQGLDLVHLYRDEGVSAGKPLSDRPMGRELMQALEAGEAVHVVAIKLDRLFRSAVDCLQRATEWDQAGIAMHLIDHGGQSINTSSAMGRFFLTLMAGMAEWERNVIGERTAAALAQKRKRGERLGGTPLGFTTPEPGAEMQPDSQELEAVRLILRRRRGGKSFRDIAAELDLRGLPTKRGGKWHACTVRNVWEARDRYRAVLAA